MSVSDDQDKSAGKDTTDADVQSSQSVGDMVSPGASLMSATLPQMRTRSEDSEIQYKVLVHVRVVLSQTI